MITVLDTTDPVADAGLDQTVGEDTLVMFDGSGSTDNAGIESYTWAFSENGKARTLKGISPNYIFMTPGIYVVTLNVTDAAEHSDVDTVQMTVLDVTPPVADAGSDITVHGGTSVTLNGSACTDNVCVESYGWTFLEDDTMRILTGISPTYNFTSPGDYVVTLNVTDAAGNWDTDTVTVSLSSSDGSFPLWDVVLVALVAVAIVIGAASFVLRGRKP